MPRTIQDEKTMFKIGKVNTLFFGKREYEFENSLEYRQKFFTTDNIVIQVIGDSERPSCILKNMEDYTKVFRILNTKQIGENLYLYYDTITGLEDGVYQIIIGGYKSQVFEVTSNENILKTTALIKYTHKSNLSPFSNIFRIDGEPVVFEHRVECGFKSNGFQPKLEAEAYRDQFQEVHQTYSYPYLVETLTIGDACGVPNYYADWINDVLCLDYVEIDGQQIRRNDAVVPTLNAVMEGKKAYNVTVDVEVINSDLEDIDGTVYRLLVDENGHYITDENGSVLTAEL